MAEEAKSSKESVRSKIEASVEAQQRRAEQERRREIIRREIDISRAAANAHKRFRFGEAIQGYHQCLRLFEIWKQVPRGELKPTHFDQKRELIELLMLTGVMWDMVRIYDFSRTRDKETEFRQYMNRYISFAKGKPYTTLCAETLRKYIQNDKPVHKREFRNAYRAITGKNVDTKCFIVTSVAEYTELDTVLTLREFRDQVIRPYYLGRNFIYYYYKYSPKWVEFIHPMPVTFKKALGKLFDVIAMLLRLR